MRDRAATAFCQNEPNLIRPKGGWPKSGSCSFLPERTQFRSAQKGAGPSRGAVRFCQNEPNLIRSKGADLSRGKLFVFARTNPIWYASGP